MFFYSYQFQEVYWDFFFFFSSSINLINIYSAFTMSQMLYMDAS